MENNNEVKQEKMEKTKGKMKNSKEKLMVSKWKI